MKIAIKLPAAVVCCLYIIGSVYSQTTIITDDPAYNTGETSAILDVKSTDKGVLVPRITQAQRNLISNPAAGLLIYNTDENSFNYFSGASWINLSSSGPHNWVKTGDDIYNTNAGNVGIGISSPLFQLHVQESLKAEAGYFGSIPQNMVYVGSDFLGGETGLIDYQTEKIIAGKDYATGIFQYGGELGSNEGLFVNSGNVGIGTSAPATKQHILGEGTADNPLLTIETTEDDAVSLSLKTQYRNWLVGQNMSNNGLPVDGFYIYDKTADAARMVIRTNGNIGIGVNNPTTQLHIGGSIRFAGAGTPGPGKILTSDASGNATWGPPFAMPTGSSMQTLRHDGSGWVASGLLRNSGTGLGIYANPLTNTQLVVYRPEDFMFGPGYSNVYAVRGYMDAESGGSSWSLSGIDAAIKGHSEYGNNFSAAIAGYSFLDYASSAAVIGSIYNGTTYGALGFKDIANNLWAGYFNGDVNISGSMRIQGGSPDVGKVLTSDSDGNATWETPSGGSNWTVSGTHIYNSNAGNVGIGTTSPVALLHTIGTASGGGNVVFAGSFKGTPGAAPVSGAGTRMMWYPDKAAFRVGGVVSNQWNQSNIGDYSIAMGLNTIASGFGSTAIGESTNASGDFSFTVGYNTQATGESSAAFGEYTHAKSFCETVFGIYNTEYTPDGGTGSWDLHDRLFIIGNGLNDANRKDALIVYKSGKIETFSAPNKKAVQFLNIEGTRHQGVINLYNHDEKRTVKIDGELNSQDPGGQIRLYDGINDLDNEYTMYLTANFAGSGKSRIITDQVQITGGSDLAEHFNIISAEILPVAGMVVSIDPLSSGKLILSDTPYDKKVAGIISGANGVDPGMVMGQKGSIADGEYPVSLTGRVYVYASDQNGKIEPGDLLTTSSTPGYAMKVIDQQKAFGAIIGKAMTSLNEQGFVLVLVNLQ